MITTGQRVGHYELLEKLGEGGMGVVYKARDLHLQRFVAIKLLLPEKVGHEHQVQRFAQEARAASTLNHPNIITVHDISMDQGEHFIVMEYVRGKALDQIIPNKGMVLNQVLKIGLQMAEALSAAAAAGIVHRDLKPSNVMVNEAGLVKVVDFGLAKLLEPETSDETVTMGNDSDRPQTREGTILGTLAYMSPEQAEGRPLDARSDIFSFGAVLYEMVTGHRAFRGSGTISLITAILRDEPQPVSELIPDVPHDLEKIISRCLRKDPERRFQSMAEVRLALLELKEETDSGKLITRERKPISRARRWPLAAALVLVAGAIGAAIWLYVQAHASRAEPQVYPLASYSGFQRDPTFSPDGKQIAFAWTGLGGAMTHIYVKIIGTDTPLQLSTDTHADSHPVWSPDGKSVAFLRALTADMTGLYEIGALGGGERQIAQYSSGAYPTLSWSRDGKWLVTSARSKPDSRSEIVAVSAASGEIRPIALGGTRDEFYPSLSADSRYLAFARAFGDTDWDIYTVRVNEELQPAGAPQHLTTPHGLNRQPAWTADNKEIIFANGGTATTRLWRAKVGSTSPAEPLTMTGEVTYQPTVSPSGDRLAYAHDYNTANIWTVQITGPGRATPPVQAIAAARSSWVRPHALSPDGRKILFESNRSGPYGIWTSNIDGSGAVFLFGSTDYVSGSPAWSPDGKLVAFDTRRDRHAQVWVIPAGGGVAHPVTQGDSDNMVPSWSGDSKWLYFDSNRTGRLEVFKIPLAGGTAVQVTRNGGWAAQESRDGKWVFYSRTRAFRTPLLKMPREGGSETQVLPEVHERWWAADDEGVWFMRSSAAGTDPGLWSMETSAPDSGSLHYFRFATGLVSQVATFTKSPGGGLAMSGDQKTLAYNQVDHRATELLLVENFR